MRCPKCECLNLEDASTCYNCGSPLASGVASYASPSADLELSPRKGFRPIWLLWGCGGLLVAFLLLLGSCYLAVKGGMAVGEREFSPAVETYLAKVRAGDYHGAYRDFGDEMHQVVGEADYVALETGLQEKLGSLQKKTVQFVQTGADLKGRWGRIVYACEFEHAKGTLAVALRKHGDKWEIAQINYNSPIFLESLKAKTLPQTGGGNKDEQSESASSPGAPPVVPK